MSGVRVRAGSMRNLAASKFSLHRAQSSADRDVVREYLRRMITQPRNTGLTTDLHHALLFPSPRFRVFSPRDGRQSIGQTPFIVTKSN